MIYILQSECIRKIKIQKLGHSIFMKRIYDRLQRISKFQCLIQEQAPIYIALTIYIYIYMNSDNKPKINKI